MTKKIDPIAIQLLHFLYAVCLDGLLSNNSSSEDKRAHLSRSFKTNRSLVLNNLF